MSSYSKQGFTKTAKRLTDDKIDENSGIWIVKWNDNSVDQLTLNFVATDLIQSIFWWNKSPQLREKVEWPNIFTQHNRVWVGWN